jgi:hypothetical protein
MALVSRAARANRRCDREGMVDEGAKVVIGDVLDGEGQR